MKNYYVKTDAFAEEVAAPTLDAAIADAFDGEIAGVTNLRTLKTRFRPYVEDGGWCWIEEDGVRVVEIGNPR